MKSKQDLGKKFLNFDNTNSKGKSQMVIKKLSKPIIDENEVVTYAQLEPMTLITLNSSVVNYKIGALNQFNPKRKKNGSISSPLMTIQQFKNKQLDQKISVSTKVYNDFVKKKQREFTLFIILSMGFLCCVTILVIHLQQNYTPEIKSLF